MALSWKQNPDSTSALRRKIPLNQALKFFAVDASGSTSGHIIQVEGQFVENLCHSQDSAAKWGSSCSKPKALLRQINRWNSSYWDADQGGTYPGEILRCKSATECVQKADVWYLMTDGEIHQNDVQELASLANRERVTNVPVCLVVFGTRRKNPDSMNISVGIPVYATAAEAIILFKDVHSRQVYVVAAKGVFSALAKTPNHVDLSQWDNLACFDDENSFAQECESRGIKVTRSIDRHDTPAVSLGQTWDSSTGVLVDIDALLSQNRVDTNDIDDLLEEETFEQLALICKTRRKLADLRSFLLRHKQEEMIVRLKDIHGAGQILQELHESDPTSVDRQELTRRLREAHAANRQAYLAERDFPSAEVRGVKKLNRAVDHALSLLAEVEKADYTADILERKSNRARRAEVLSNRDAEVHLSSLDLSDSVDASRSTCNICCGEAQVMSVVLKKLGSVEENTSDFFLNFPLVAAQAQQNADMVSSQCICFQCATLMGGKSIFQEDLSAILPVVSYTRENKHYIVHQLTMAITAGLATGAAGVVQMFMSILDHTLRTKQWCSSQANIQHPDPEVACRRQTLEWMLNNLLHTCITRERFSDETSRWVEYPLALKWAGGDFESNKLDSWIIQYPLKGFNQLMRWYELLDSVVPQAIIEQMKVTKLLNVVVSSFMAELLHAPKDREWVYPFIQLIYRGFNATNVPQDLGSTSVLDSGHFWPKLENIFATRQDGKEFLAGIPPSRRSEVCRRVQVVVFWAIFTQKEHVTAKGFFHKLFLREALGAAVLNSASELPGEDTVQNILTSILLEQGKSTDSRHDGVPPFVTPFGPSIISCGKQKCGMLFYDPSEPATLDPDTVRKRRAEHLNSVFQNDAANETGLPEPVNAPERPKSVHYTLHMSIVKVWSTLPRFGQANNPNEPFQAAWAPELSKEDIMNGKENAVSDFVSRVREHICTESRRGNIYHSGFEAEIRELLPSLFDVLRVASEKDGLADRSGLSYVHDWTKNKLANKIEYEKSLSHTA
ncbi:MAG: hypothetical protein Q9216_004263 [Gyalolechia sp. 2 TL-2023]